MKKGGTSADSVVTGRLRENAANDVKRMEPCVNVQNLTDHRKNRQLE